MITGARRGRLLGSAVAAAVILAVHAAGAAGAPARAASVGPNVINDPHLLAREGLVPDADPAPRVVREPLLSGWIIPDGTAHLDPRGGVLVLGRYGWLFRGPNLRTLSASGWIDGLKWITYAAATADGGFTAVESISSSIVAVGADGRVRWTAGPEPTSIDTGVRSPIAAGPAGLVYAVGGTPSVLDAVTGRVVARLQAPPAVLENPVVAPDRTLRATGGTLDSRSAALFAYGQDGRLLWSTPLGADPSGRFATTPSIGPDGTTYVGRWAGLGRHTRGGEVVAIGPDGAIRWRVHLGRQPSRPAIDARGFVWAVTRDGVVSAVDDTGRIAFRRTVAPGESASVAALGTGVLVQSAGAFTRLEARPARAAAPRGPGLAVTPTRATARARGVCAAPPTGRPRTCVYPTTTGAELVMRAPVAGRTTIAIRREGSARILYRQGPYRVLAGVNRIGIDLASGGGFGHAATAGRYVVQASVPTGSGRTRVLSARFVVVPSAGRAIG